MTLVASDSASPSMTLELEVQEAGQVYANTHMTMGKEVKTPTLNEWEPREYIKIDTKINLAKIHKIHIIKKVNLV